MPYDTKPTGALAGSGAPEKVDFNRLWEKLSVLPLKPAVARLAVND
jgi:hypothetical protein